MKTFVIKHTNHSNSIEGANIEMCITVLPPGWGSDGKISIGISDTAFGKNDVGLFTYLNPLAVEELIEALGGETTADVTIDEHLNIRTLPRNAGYYFEIANDDGKREIVLTTTEGNMIRRGLSAAMGQLMFGL